MKESVDTPITPPSPLAQKPRVHPAYYIALFIVIVVLGVVYFAPEQFFFPKKTNQNQSTIEKTTPTPTPRPIPHGPKGFTVGQGDKTVPQFGKGMVDPYDPEKGSMQSMTIKVNHTQPVATVTATVKTDNGISTPYSLSLIDGTNTNGTWKGSWQINDSYLYTYAIILKAESNKNASVEITLR